MADPKDYYLDSEYEDEYNGDGSVDCRKTDFYAVHRETGERHCLDTSPNQFNLPVEEWLLHVKLDFPSRSEAGAIGPLRLSDLIQIEKQRKGENP